MKWALSIILVLCLPGFAGAVPLNRFYDVEWFGGSPYSRYSKLYYSGGALFEIYDSSANPLLQFDETNTVFSLAPDGTNSFEIDTSTGDTIFGHGDDYDLSITFNANTNDGLLQWMEDEDYFLSADDIRVNGMIGVNTAPTHDLDIYKATGSSPEIILSAEDVAGHGMTTILEADEFGSISEITQGEGGLEVLGIGDGDYPGVGLKGYIGAADPTNTMPAIRLTAAKKSGTGSQAIGAVETAVGVDTDADSTDEVVFRGDGDIETLGTIQTTAGNAWDLQDFAATAPAATGYVVIVIDEAPIYLLAAVADGVMLFQDGNIMRYQDGSAMIFQEGAP